MIGYQSFEEHLISLTEDIANDKDRWVYSMELKRKFMKFEPSIETFVTTVRIANLQLETKTDEQ